MKDEKYRPLIERIIRICSIILFLLVSVLLVSCSKDEKNHIDTVDKRERENKPFMEVAESALIETTGWLSRDEILTIEQDDDGQAVFLHQFNEEEPVELFRTSDAIMSADASASGEYVAITHSSKSDSATLLIINREGKQVLSRDIISSYVLLEWDDTENYKEQLLVMALQEDWSYDSWLINADTKEESELNLPKPFIQWLDGEHIAYMGDANDRGLPVHQYGMEMKDNRVIYEDAVGIFSKYGRTIIASVDEEGDSMTLQVYAKGEFEKPIKEIEIPAIKKDEDYLMPYLDVPADGNRIFVLAPLTENESSLYELLEWDMMTNETERIVDRINNEPIASNMDGTYCLYGHLLDSLIDLEERTIEKIPQAEIM
ncbi:YqgU-like beta propeller domain-containing protein [Pradoshia sp.]